MRGTTNPIPALCAAVALAWVGVVVPHAQPASRTKLVMLGTGTPNADPDRSGPAVAVVVDDRSYLVDAGVGIVRRAAAAERAGVPALAAAKLQRAFITHLHSDHTLGLADLILTPWILERERPLALFGPKGLRAMVDHLVAAYAMDLDVRTTGGEPKHAYDPRTVDVREAGAGEVYRDELVVITAFSVGHGAWGEAFGYRFKTPDRTIVVSGDTGPDSGIEKQCQPCDVLVHEVYSEAGFAGRPKAWQAYHSRYHTSSRQLGALAAQAKPGLLVLYHQLIWGSTEDALVQEVRSAFSGRVVSAHDLDVY